MASRSVPPPSSSSSSSLSLISLLALPPLTLAHPRPQLPENDDIQSMWAPDVHKVKPASALAQLVAMFGAVGLFALGVYEVRASAPMVRPPPSLSFLLSLS